MSYTVLALKYRSNTFDEVVGQAPVVATLRNAIAQNRVHHGYLFCGTRGVGKTSMARILAKAMNCLSSDGPTTTPCGACDSCKMIARGEDVDVVEIDAASNNSVDNIRDLRNNAVFRPARSRFKVYIIDEVHMLSPGAFNALLKTLEEPPDHVKFILATTEAHKVPATILSRVQRFDFKAIAPAEIAEQLKRICDSESVDAEDDALKRLARLANGSMRDGLSLLDQVMSMGGGRVTKQIVNELLPSAHDERFGPLIDRLAESDAAGALAAADAVLTQGETLDRWCSLLANQLRDLMVLRLCGEQTDLVDVPAGLRKQLHDRAQTFDGGAYVYMITVLEELRRSVRSSGAGRALLEAAVVRLAEASKFSSIETLLGAVGSPTTDGPAQSTPPAGRRTSTTAPAKDGPRTPVASAPPSPPTRRPAPHRRTPTVSAAAPPPKRMSQADLNAARAEPVVRAALEVFGGQIVHVHRPDSESQGPTAQRTENA